MPTHLLASAARRRQLRWKATGLRGVAGAQERRQNRTMGTGDFAQKLGLMLKAINLSRGRLA
jgi:hypothetical protein